MRKEVSDVAKSRMKQLQWDKLTPQHAAETIWGQTSVSEQELASMLREQGMFDEMEEDFKARNVAKRPAQAAKKEKMEFKTHLTLQTRQGIEMVLRRIKSSLTDAKHATPEEVAHHIVNCNEAVLDQSFLEELLRHYPESEVKGQLGEYRNASDEELRLLHPADRLVVLLMTVPHLKDKVKGLLYMTKYREAVDIIKEGATRVREGSETLMQAPNFAKLLSLILMMGNFLNSSGMQGGAFGFKISSINKLVDTKAGDGTTLLHFVERTISRCFPETEAFLEELDKPSEACRVQLLDLKRDLAELKSGSTQHKKELHRFLDESEDRLEDPYTKLMLPFLNEVQGELTRLSDQVQFSEHTFHEALRYFGEGPDPKRRGFPAPQSMRTEDFFGIFREFQAAYKKVKLANVQLAELRSAEAKRRAAAEERERERQEAIKRKEAGVDDSAVLETLLTNLRGGNTTPKRKRKTQGRPGRDTGRASGGGADTPGTDGGSVTLGTGASNTSIDGNPSDIAQAMLAKLQGGESGGVQQTGGETRASMSYASRRRPRERRGTIGANPATTSMYEEADKAGSVANEDTTGSHTERSASEHDAASEINATPSAPAFNRTNSAPERPPRRSQVSEKPKAETNEDTDSEASGSLYSANGADDDVESEHAGASNDSHLSPELEDTFDQTSNTVQPLQGNQSAEFVLEQGEWFDPDSSNFMNTSTGSADRTARP
jgi:cytokinesis protein